MLIWPLASSVEMPAMSWDSPRSNSSAPTMLSVRNRLPGQPSLMARSIVYSKSLAMTCRPLEYTSPLRRASR